MEDISPDEICVSNIQKISNMCFILSKKQETIRLSLPTINEFEKKGTPIEMPLDKYYSICIILGDPLPTEFESYTEQLLFLKNTLHMYISTPTLFKESLEKLTLLLHEIQLIFVDEVKGYCIWNKLDHIKFERITRGHPRFRVCN